MWAITDCKECETWIKYKCIGINVSETYTYKTVCNDAKHIFKKEVHSDRWILKGIKKGISKDDKPKLPICYTAVFMFAMNELKQTITTATSQNGSEIKPKGKKKCGKCIPYKPYTNQCPDKDKKTPKKGDGETGGVA